MQTQDIFEQLKVHHIVDLTPWTKDVKFILSNYGCDLVQTSEMTRDEVLDNRYLANGQVISIQPVSENVLRINYK